MNQINHDYLISVCVPTYNQPTSVRALFEQLYAQYSPHLEIIVRDDSTNEDTKAIIKEFENLMPVRYFHGKRDGLDSALIFLIQQAKGKYIWWIGDDVLLPNGLKKIIDVLEQNINLSFVWVNSCDILNENLLTVSDVGSRLFKNKNDVLLEVTGLRVCGVGGHA